MYIRAWCRYYGWDELLSKKSKVLLYVFAVYFTVKDMYTLRHTSILNIGMSGCKARLYKGRLAYGVTVRIAA